MISVKVLLENTTISKEFRNRHGLSLAIQRDDRTLLLDVGPDRRFLHNAPRLGVDVARAETLLLSHHHVDHTGGLDHFCAANEAAPVHLFGDTSVSLYARVLQALRVPIGLRCSRASRARIVEHQDDVAIDERTHFLRHTRRTSPMPSLNVNLLMREQGTIRPDDFRHEGVLVLLDGDEMVLFNSCSHNGVINSIETALARFPDSRIRAYVGGFHFRDPISRRTEKPEALEAFADHFATNDIRLYTGHCTGEKVITHLQGALGPDRVVPIRTGMTVQV